MTEDLIQKTAIRKKGGAGPSKFDAEDWQIIFGSNVFGSHSLKLQESLARMKKSYVPRNWVVMKVWMHSLLISQSH